MTAGKLISVIAMAVFLTGLASSANIFRSSDSSEPELRTKTLNLDDEATVEDAGSSFKPFFYASTPTTPGGEDEEVAKEEDSKDEEGISEDDLRRMIDEVVKEVRAVESLEPRGFPFWNPLLEPDYPQPEEDYDFPPSFLPPPPPFGRPPYFDHLLSAPPLPPRRPSPGHRNYPDYGVRIKDVCPPCSCDYHDDDNDDLEDEEDLAHYDFDFDPTYRYNRRGRSKRSVGDYYSNYWTSMVGPSEHLAKYNVGYRIKNDLRKRIQASRYWPLWYGYLRAAKKNSKKNTKNPKNTKKHSSKKDPKHIVF